MANIAMTVENLRRSARKSLEQAGIESADLDVKILLRESFGWDASDLIANANTVVPKDGLAKFEAMLSRRKRHEPIAYIVGKQPFWSLEFEVNPDVLIPRPETEGAVERALELIKDIKSPTLADIGTGSGAILLSLLHDRQDATGIGLDISTKALEVAKINAARLDLAERVKFIRSDYTAELNERAHLVVSNPPYITDKAMGELPDTVADYEPDLALRGGDDGLTAYRTIIADLDRVLVPNGAIVFEIGYDQGAAVAGLLAQHGFAQIRVDKDLAGHDRIVSGKLSV